MLKAFTEAFKPALGINLPEVMLKYGPHILIWHRN